MGPGPALDGFVQEAPKSHVVIGPDGDVEPGKYDRVAVTVRDRGELRALRVPKGVRTRGAGGLARRGQLGALADPASGVAGAEDDPVPGRRRRLADRAPLRRIGARAPRRHRARPAGGLARPRRPARRRAGRGGDRQGGRRPVGPAPTPTRWSRSGRSTSGCSTRSASSARSTDRWSTSPSWTGAAGRPRPSSGGCAATSACTPTCPQATPLLAARVIAGLAMAGMPLSADRVATRVAAHLGEAVTAAITTEVDLTDPQAREEHSVVLRRAALTAYSSTAWRTRLGELAGVRVGSAARRLGRDGHPPPRPAGARGRPGRPAARRRPARAGAGPARLRGGRGPGPRARGRRDRPGRAAARGRPSSATCCTPRRWRRPATWS